MCEGSDSEEILSPMKMNKLKSKMHDIVDDGLIAETLDQFTSGATEKEIVAEKKAAVKNAHDSKHAEFAEKQIAKVRNARL